MAEIVFQDIVAVALHASFHFSLIAATSRLTTALSSLFNKGVDNELNHKTS